MPKIETGREDSPSEQSPLLASSSSDYNSSHESKTSVSFRRGLSIIFLMGLLIFIQATNMSMMTTAQSDIAADLDAFAEATWFTSAYMISLSSITPLTGRLSEIFTPRVYVIFSSVILSIGLFVTAVAHSFVVFVLGRVIAGCGSAGLLSTAIILALDLSSSKRRGLFIGLINCGFTTGVASGAVLAGLITPIWGWRFIFWVQAPVALAVGPLLFLAIPRSGDLSSLKLRELLHRLSRVDYAGASALTLAVVLLLFSLASPEILLWPIPLAFASFAVFIKIENRVPEPVIPVRLLQSRSVLLTCVSGLGLMMARWAVLFFTPTYAIAVRGWSPASAGLILIPTNAGFGVGGLLVGWLHIRKPGSYYISCLVIFLLFAIATAVLAGLSTPESHPALYLATTFFNGLFAGSLMNYTLSHVLHLTSTQVHYTVSALIAMSRGFAGSFGSAIGGGFFTRILKSSLEMGFAQRGLPPQPKLVRTLLGSPATVAHLIGEERLIAIESYEYAIRMLFLAGSLLALVATAFQAGTGWTPEWIDRYEQDERD